MVRWLSGVEGIYMILTRFQHRHLSVRNYIWWIKLLFYSLTLSKDGKQQLPFVFWFLYGYIHVIPQLRPLALMEPVWWFPYAGKSPCQTFIQVNRPAVASSTGENPSPFVFPSFDVQKMPNSANIWKEGNLNHLSQLQFWFWLRTWVAIPGIEFCELQGQGAEIGIVFFFGTRLGRGCAWTWSYVFFCWCFLGV